MAKCGAPDWTPYTAEEEPDVPGGVFPHTVWEQSGITQVAAGGSSTSSNLTIYTVPTGKIGYITSFYIHMYNKGASEILGRLMMNNLVNVPFMNWGFYVKGSSPRLFSLSFPVPLKMNATGFVAIGVGHSDLRITASVTGYTLPA